MNYNDLEIGSVIRAGECGDLIGDELTFAQLVREPSTNRLLVWMGASVGGELTNESEFLVAQIERVVDFDPETDTEQGDEEFATVMLDIPGFSRTPVSVEYEDMEQPVLNGGDDPNSLANHYMRIWRAKRAFQPLEHLAIGAAIYSKCKANYIDSTEELLQAFRNGEIKRIFSTPQISQIRTVLCNARIEIPTEEAAPEKQKTPGKKEKTESVIVQAAPEAPSDPWTRAKALHQRIVNDAQSAAESIWDMSQAIKEMRDGKHYKALLYDNFEGYCEEALGMSRAHAYRYIQIAEGMNAENVASMRQIGTTKLALLASVTEDQREIVAAAVDVESATVKELKAEIDRLKGKVSTTEKARDNAQARYVKSDNQNLVLKDTIAAKDKIIRGKDISMDSLRSDNAQLKDRVHELESGRDHVIDELNAKITELESRPVEVAVQDNSAALKQLRKELGSKISELEQRNEDLSIELEYRCKEENEGEFRALCQIAKDTLHRITIYLLHHPGATRIYDAEQLLRNAVKEIVAVKEDMNHE